VCRGDIVRALWIECEAVKRVTEPPHCPLAQLRGWKFGKARGFFVDNHKKPGQIV
jgi:hypothetical protein